MREIIVDSFAGGGGASTGIELALGRSPDVAINHDAEALAMHSINHPHTQHLNNNIWQVDPDTVMPGAPVGLLWASPDCKHFSKAKGGKPVERNIRDLAWIVVLWAQRRRPRVIILENVEEFQTWGPLTEGGTPCPVRKGETFNKWRGELRRLGYKVEWRELRACDYGAPTIRKRLFLIARCDKQPIIWPKPTHGDPKSDAVKSGQLLPWRTAAEIIDWSLPCPSIFLTREEGRAVGCNRPLAENTMARIAKGVKRYVLDAAKPFIVTCNHSGEHFRGQGLDEPFKTITAARDAHGLVTPFITKFRSGATGSSIDEPLATVTANSFINRPGGAAPIGIVAPVLTYAQQGGAVRDPQDPLNTVTASRKDQNAIIAAHIQRDFGQSIGSDAAEPIGTVTAGGGGHSALVATFLAQHNAGPRPGAPGHEMTEPVTTVTATGSQQNVVAAHLTHLYGSGAGNGDMESPIKTVTAGGQHAGLVAAFMTKYYGTDGDPAITDPLHTITTKDRFGLITVEIDGEPMIINDIGMRMLSPRELFRAQGFPDSYVIDHGLNPAGERITLTKTAQVRMCGNSVSPVMSRALVAANFKPAHIAAPVHTEFTLQAAE